MIERLAWGVILTGLACALAVWLFACASPPAGPVADPVSHGWDGGPLAPDWRHT